MVHRPVVVHPHPLQHRMSPLESLRRFQIDCGPEIPEAPPVAPPTNPPVLPPVPLEPTIAMVDFGTLPPDLPPPTTPDVGLVPATVPPLLNVPTTPVEIALTPIPPALPPAATPEPGSFVLVLTGAAMLAEAARRTRRTKGAV
jgi:hypothetical protein